MKRYYVGQNEFGDDTTAWADIDEGHMVDCEIVVSQDTPKWRRKCLTDGFEINAFSMAAAQDAAGVQTDFVDAVRKGQIAQSPAKNEEDKQDCYKYHEDI